jgi:hypothetical protein
MVNDSGGIVNRELGIVKVEKNNTTSLDLVGFTWIRLD